MEKRRLLYVIFILLFVGGCRQDVLENIDDPAINKDGSIAFRTQPLLTRGTPQVDLTAYEKSIHLIAYSHTGSYSDGKELYRQVELSNISGVWDYSPRMFWPDARNLSFLVYAIESDIAYAATSGEEGVYIKNTSTTEAPTIEYVVPSTVENQPDLIMAALLNPAKATNITLPMKHALSCVSFCATSPDSTSMVKSITLNEVYSSGTLALDSEDIVWTNLGAKGVTVLNPGIKNDEPLRNDPSANYNYLMNANGYLMMIPQTLTDATIDVVYWKGTEGTERTITYTLPTTIKWEPGLKYIYSFDEVDIEGVVTYYEKYSDNTSGLYYYNGTTLINTIKNESVLGANTIMDAGYGLLVPSAIYTQNSSATLLMGVGNNTQRESPVCDGSIWASDVLFNGMATECVLYAMTQNKYPFGRVKTEDVGGLQPDYTNTPAVIKAKFSTGLPFKTDGYCLPHYACGVYANSSTMPTTHYIRTPIQMRNISYQAVYPGVHTEGNTYIQEFSTMDYQGAAGSTIRGNDVGATDDFTDAIVRGLFNGTFDGKKQSSGSDRANATIRNLKITSSSTSGWKDIWGSYYIALFEWVDWAGKISNLTNIGCELSQKYAGSSINAAMYVGLNNGGTLNNLINHAPITNAATYSGSRAGGIVAYNGSAGGGLVSNCTNMANITGTITVGGIAAYNNYQGKIMNCINGNSTVSPQIASTYIRYDDTYSIPRVGGIVGLQQCGNPPPATLTPIISGCINYGTVTATDNTSSLNRYCVGGIVGENDWNWQSTETTETTVATAATAFGEVNKCTNYGEISGLGAKEQGIGGIAGTNNGNVRQSQSTGLIKATGDAVAGGIVGYNTNVVEDCLYYNISNMVPITTATGYAGGIVGHNTAHNAAQASGSAYVNRCIYLAKSPINNSPVEGSVAGYAPIAGYIAEYLCRDVEGNTHLQSDGTSGTIPFYTVENCFFLSGADYNDFGGSNPQGLYEPIPDITNIAPFPYGRFPVGINRLTSAYFSTLPFMNFWGTQGWKKDTIYPYLTTDMDMSTVVRGAGNYVPYDIICSIITQNTNMLATYDFGDRTIPGVIRVELFNMATANLGNLTSITITFGTLTFTEMSTGAYAGILIKAPQGWNITIAGGTGGLSVYGDATSGSYVFLTQLRTADSITMTKQ